MPSKRGKNSIAIFQCRLHRRGRVHEVNVKYPGSGGKGGKITYMRQG